MKIKIKKTIAREIIFFFSTTLILFLVWSILEINSVHLDKKINKTNLDIEKLEFKHIILKTQLDSIEFIPPYPIKLRGTDGILLQQKKTKNTNTILSNLKENELLLKNKKDELISIKKDYLLKNENNIFFWVSIFSFSLLYPIRFLFKLISWSIRILNQKE